MKSKLITTMMTALFLTFAVIAMPLLSVPTVSAKTLKTTWIEWCSDYMPSPPSVPPVIAFAAKGDVLLFVGRMEGGGISADMYTWSTPETGTLGPRLKPEPSATFHWHQDFLLVFDGGGWVSGWDDGVWAAGNKPVLSGSVTGESRITDASSDRTNYIGCKLSVKDITAWVPGDIPSDEWGCPWGPAWGYAEGTGSISGSLNK